MDEFFFSHNSSRIFYKDILCLFPEDKTKKQEATLAARPPWETSA
jgi:hypothetical protein